MPVDTETLSESILPLVGILIKKSEFSFISLCTPLPSFPKISAIFLSFILILFISCPLISPAYIQKPCFFKEYIVLFMFVTVIFLHIDLHQS